MSVNKVQIIGRLGKDVEFKQVNENFSVAKVPIACSEKYKDKQGNQQEKTEWINCSGFNHIASLMSKYLAKGDLVYFEGKLQTTVHEKDGQKRYFTEVIVNTIDFLQPKSASQSDPLPESDLKGVDHNERRAQTGTATGAGSMDDGFDDLPFSY